MSARGIDSGLTSYGDSGFSRFLRRAFLAAAGYDRDDLDRPIVGIAHTVSDYVPCHREMPQLVEAIKRGVLQAGGLPFAFPTTPLGEILISPTSMLFRNLAAIECEELVRAQPMDAVVLVGGCDKTVPAQLLGAASADRPSVFAVAGPMLTSTWRGRRLGACTDCRILWTDQRAGGVTEGEIAEIERQLAPTGGTCMAMGSASTIACLLEAMGLTVPGSATAPAATGGRLRVGVASGRLAVRMATDGGPTPRQILTRAAFENAAVVLVALGGSTNAVIHLLALARRVQVKLTLDDFDRVARDVPLLVDCKPAGAGYLEDFDRAGGMPALLAALAPRLDLDAPHLAFGTLGEALADADRPAPWQSTIGTLERPIGGPGGLVVLHGSLAPDGAVLKVSAASPDLLRHEGPAIVFESPEDAARRLDAVEVTADHVFVLRNAGPVAAGMPEAASLPVPRRLATQGVRDVVRVSDGRMSGTAYGTVALHCSPEAAVGGPLSLVRDGDRIALDVPNRRLELVVDERELERRRRDWTPPRPETRGWRRLYAERVQQAHQGADLDLL